MGRDIKCLLWRPKDRVTRTSIRESCCSCITWSCGHGLVDERDGHLHLYLPGDVGAVRNMVLMSAYPTKYAIDHRTRVLTRGRLRDEGACE